MIFDIYTENDFDELKDMVFGLYSEDPEGMPMTESKIKKTANESLHRPEKVRIIIIRSGGAIIGYGMLTFSWSNEYGGDIVNIDELFIKDGYRNRKAASAFIRHTMETYKNAVIFELETTPSNENALKLYKKMGFEVAANTHMQYIAGGRL